MNFEELFSVRSTDSFDKSISEPELAFDDFLDGNEEQKINLKDAVMLAVDLSESIFKHNKYYDQPPILLIQSAICEFLKSKIIASDRALVGLVFYNTAESKNEMEFENIYLHFGLDIPSAEKVRLCENLNSLNLGYSNKEALFTNLFWICNNQFTPINSKNYTKRIFLFTDKDDPLATNPSERKAITNMINLFNEQDTTIELFPLRNSEGFFNINKYFGEIISIPMDEANLSSIDLSERIFDLTKRMKAKEYHKRTLASLQLQINSEESVGVKIFVLLNKEKKPFPLKVDARTNKILKSETQFICKDTGSKLFPNQLKTCAVVANEKIPISKKDLNTIKNIELPGLKLLGFKDETFLKPYHNMTHSYFLACDETKIQGSSAFFDALIDQMMEKKKIGIVKFVAKSNSTIKLAALVPQKESFDEDNFQIPPGFNLIVLPYSDEIQNQIPFENPPKEMEKNKLLLAKLLVNSFTNEIDCRDFENPGIQNFYSKLQAIALEEENSGEVLDSLQPDIEGMSRYKDLSDNFRSVFNLPKDNSHLSKSPKRKKRDSTKVFQASKDSSRYFKRRNWDRKSIKVLKVQGSRCKSCRKANCRWRNLKESRGFKPKGNKTELFEQAQMAMIPNN